MQTLILITIIFEKIIKIMLYLNSCPRCSKGTIEYNEDSDGKSIKCLMCGFSKTSISNAPKKRKSKIS